MKTFKDLYRIINISNDNAIKHFEIGKFPFGTVHIRVDNLTINLDVDDVLIFRIIFRPTNNDVVIPEVSCDGFPNLDNIIITSISDDIDTMKKSSSYFTDAAYILLSELKLNKLKNQ